MSEFRSPWPRFRPGLSAWGPSPQPWFPVRPSRGSGISFPEPRSRLPGFRAQKVGIPGPKVGIPGPQSRKFGSPRPELRLRSARVAGGSGSAGPHVQSRAKVQARYRGGDQLEGPGAPRGWLRAKVKKRSEPLKQPQSRMNAGEVDVLDFKQLCVSRCSLAPATGPPSHPSAPRRTSFTQRWLASALGRDRSTPRGCSPSSRSRDSSSRRTSGRTPTLQ